MEKLKKTGADRPPSGAPDGKSFGRRQQDRPRDNGGRVPGADASVNRLHPAKPCAPRVQAIQCSKCSSFSYILVFLYSVCILPIFYFCKVCANQLHLLHYPPRILISQGLRVCSTFQKQLHCSYTGYTVRTRDHQEYSLRKEWTDTRCRRECKPSTPREALRPKGSRPAV